MEQWALSVDTAAGLTWVSNAPIADIRLNSTALSSTTLTLSLLQGEGWQPWLKTATASSPTRNELMPGPLKNPKHEAFVRHMLEGKDITTAFELAGFNRDSGNANRLLKRPQVQARLRELQDEIAAKVPITIESLIGELEDARQSATGKNQFAAAIKAILGKAQLAGLLIDRSKVEVTNTDPFHGLESVGDIGLAMIDGWSEHKIAAWADYRDEDRQHLAQLFVGYMQEFNTHALAYIESIHARPKRTVNLKALPSPLNGKAQENDSQPTTD